MTERPRADDVFFEALQRPTADRGAYVRSACGDDERLRHEVLSLLEAHDRAGGFLETPAIAARGGVDDGRTDPSIGRRVGAWRLVRHVATGGMGEVYLGERAHGDFVQRAAVKLIHRGVYDAEAMRRFRNECHVLARLEHPNIARMIDGGISGDGTPYIVMEFVAGEPIDRYCAGNNLSVERRLRLFADVCGAVEHAHKHSTIHRDIKPGNILVDDGGVVKLVDFGIARVLDAAEGALSERTATGLHVMTPHYASPEQIRGEMLSTATDVYSLGVVLYRLLTGTLPYAAAATTAREIERLQTGTPPARPSEMILRATETPETVPTGAVDTRRLSRRLRGDLDTIVLMALRHEPERRYESAQQFADDIRRHLDGLPVLARPDTLSYRTAKFVRRHTAAVAAGAALAVVLVASSVTGFWLYARSERARRAAETARVEAERNARTAERVTQFMVGLFEQAAPENTRGAALGARELLDRGADRVRSELNDTPLVKARVLQTVASVYHSMGDPDAARALFEESVALYRLHLDAFDRDLVGPLTVYGDFLSDTGDAGGAVTLHREALAIKERYHAPDDPSLAALLNRIALENRGGDLRENLALFERTLAIKEKELGPDDPQIAYYLVNVANARRALGELDPAREALERALAIRERHLDPDHPEIATTLGSLAAVLNTMERFDDAIRILRRAIDIRETVYGPENPRITPSLNSLANAYAETGRRAEARTLYERCLAINTAAYGPDHPYVGYDNNNLGYLLKNNGEFEAARPLFERALEIWEPQYGPDHRILAWALTGLGEVEAAAGNHARAIELFERALEIREHALGPDHPYLPDTLEPYARSLRASGREADAKAAEARAQQIREHPSDPAAASS